MTIHLTQHKIDKITRLAKAHTMRDTAKQVGLTYNQLMYQSKKRGIKFQKRGELNANSVLDNHDIELVNLLIADGMKDLQIARKFDVSHTLIYRIRNGLTRVHG